MLKPHLATRFVLPTLVLAGLTLGTGTLLADINGRTGRAQSANGCNCHGARSTGVTVSIAGPQTVSINSSNTYTVTVSGSPAGGGGFDLKVSGGTLAAGANNHVVGTEVTHDDGSSRSWTFTWTAPATAGTQNFYAVAVAADRDDSESGDAWNWYGGAVNTAFPITVQDLAGVAPGASASWLATPTPNPCSSGARIAYSLARGSRVRIELLDPAGRRVRTLVDGDRPAGPQSAPWDGRDDDGARVAPGVYLVHLAAPGIERTSRLVVVW